MAAIYRRERTDAGWRYVRVKTGRGRRPVDSPPYYLRFTIAGKRKWSDPFDTLQDAQNAAVHLPDVVEAQSKNLTLGELEESRNANRVRVKAAVATYLDQKKSKSPKTHAQYRVALNQFLASLGKVRFVDEITPDVLRQFKRAMENEGFAGKTIDTRLNVVYFLLKKNGSPVRLPKDEMPTVEEEPAVPFSDEEIEKLLAAMNAEEKIRYKFFLGTACRDREVTFAAWNDVNFEKKTFTVRSKPDVGFTPKSHESRTMRIPSSLVDLLKARRKNAPHDRWIFVNDDGRPDNHFLRKLKRIALRAKVNCGQCKTTLRIGKFKADKREQEVTCKTHPVCKHVFLHRLRKTCATRWQEHGIPVRTIQAWLGHKNLETTMIYLGVTDTAKLGNEVDAAFGD
jgi:integrase/recombinase XerD